MKRWAVACAVGLAILASSAAPATASPKWSAVSSSTANRWGYTEEAPSEFNAALPSILGAFIGSSYDASTTPAMWGRSFATDAQGLGLAHSTAYQGYVRQNTNVWTTEAGSDFAFAYSWGHFKDGRLSGNTGQFLLPTVNNTVVKRSGWSSTLPFYRNVSIPGNDGWGGYNLASGSAVSTSGVGTDDMPSARYVSVRSFFVIAGKWVPAANAYRVRTGVVCDDGDVHTEVYSREATYVAGSYPLGFYATLDPNGYLTERTKIWDHVSVTRVQDAGVELHNAEWLEAAVTTDTAEVAAVYNKLGTPTDLQVALDGAVSASGSGSGSDDESDLPSALGGWQDWIQENVTDPLSESFANFGDLLWFVDPVKEWFGLG